MEREYKAPKYSPSKTVMLAESRKAAGLNQTDAAGYFGLGVSGRNEVSKWETGQSKPKKHRRSRFVSYLWDKLRLREKYKKFLRIWKEIMEEEWEWAPLRDDEYPPDFPPEAFPWRKEPLLQPEQPPPHFVVRKKHVGTLEKALLAEEHHGPITMVGPPGAGKTALAAYITRELKEEFPGGVLWCDIDAGEPMSLLKWIALRCGRHDVREFENVRSRGQLVRGILADKRVLLVLDAAPGINEVELFLPPPGPCAVIITSQNRTIFGLTTTPRQMDVGPFEKREGSPETDEVLQLAVKILGEKRVQEEHAALSELAAELEYLPFALDIALSTIARRPHWSVSTFLNELRSVNQRLDLLKEVKGRSVRAAFEVAYKALEQQDLQEFFAMLGVFGSRDFSIEAAAHVTQHTVGDAQRYLDRLFDVCLVKTSPLGRSSLHSLLGDFAKEKNTANDAYERMYSFYAQRLRKLDQLYREGDDDHRQTMTTFEREWANIKYAQEKVCSQPDDDSCVALCSEYGLASRLLLHYHLPANDRIAWWQVTLAAAERLGDKSAMGWHLSNLALAYAHSGNFGEAITRFEEALELLKEVGDELGACITLDRLGLICSWAGDHSRALKCHRQALAVAQSLGDRRIEANALGNMGMAFRRAGALAQAIAHFEQSLTIIREIEDRLGEAATLNDLANVYRDQEQFERAAAHYEDALTIARQLDYHAAEADALGNLGDVHLRMGHCVAAIRFYRLALQIDRRMGSRDKQAQTLNSLGELMLMADKPQHALRYSEKVLSLVSDFSIGHDTTKADAFYVKGRALCALGRHTDGLALLRKTQKLYESLDDSLVDEVRHNITRCEAHAKKR